MRLRIINTNTKRGFNLIELAFVLMIVGGALGGIWLATSAVKENLHASETVKGVFLIVKNTQNLVTIANSEQIGHGISITSAMMKSNVFPQDWVQNNTIKAPYGGSVGLTNYLTPNRFDLTLSNIPKPICFKVLAQIVGSKSTGYDNGLNSFTARSNLGVYQYSGSIFPISPDVINTACQSDYNFLILTFRFLN